MKNQNYKIAIYIRVSTEEQTENPEGSLKNQEQRLREAVEWKNKNSNFGEIAGVYIDAGISAKDMNRPRLQDMLRAIKLGEVNLVMVTELSRLSRNNRDFIGMWDMMHDCKCSFMSLREDFDTTTAAGEMLLFQLINFAQFERKTTSERVSANIKVRASRGLYNGGPIPFGYKRLPEKIGYLAVHPENSALVKIAFDTLLREGCLSHAAKWLNEKGFSLDKHLEGGGSKMRIGHFTVDNLHKMIRNKAYLGIKTYSAKGEETEVKAVWDAIIDEVTFKRANDLLTKNRSRYKPVKENRHPYLLSGISFCMSCGDHMPGKSATGRNGKVAYYEHSWATKRDSCLTKKIFKCNPQRIQAKLIEPVVWDLFLKFIGSTEMIKEFQKETLAVHLGSPELREEDRLKAKLYGINSQLEAVAERITLLPKTVSANHFFKQMEKLELHKKEIEEGLLSEKKSPVPKEDMLVRLQNFDKFAEYFRNFLTETSDFTTRKKILQKFIHRIEIGEDKIKVKWILDRLHYENETMLVKKNIDLKTKAPSLDGAFKTFSANVGSQSLTNGAQ